MSRSENLFPQMQIDRCAKALLAGTSAGDQFDEVQWRIVVLQTQALVKAD
jgi:hypothetical protein